MDQRKRDGQQGPLRNGSTAVIDPLGQRNNALKTQNGENPLKVAEYPFHFVTASYLTRICNQKATNLLELGRGLEDCTDASIFYHTFQSLSRHHFLTEGFSNDFAQWALASCNRAELAEKLAALDIRDYLTLAELRSDLRRLVDEFCQIYPQYAQQLAFEPLYFCESIEVTVPLDLHARTLGEFREGFAKLNPASLNFHFISSRLRLQLRTNDFSYWFESSLGLPTLAKRTNQIDIYTNTLDGVQATLLSLVDKELKR
jgi:hypothetical protein